MARPFTSQEANRMIALYKTTIAELDRLNFHSQQIQNDIKIDADTWVGNAVMRSLKEISVDEINRDKRGIRIKALKNYGYNTIADLAAASVYQIGSVHGISMDRAYEIKRIVNEIVDNTSKLTKIKLSYDDQTKEASSLIYNLYLYQKSKPLSLEAEALVASKKNAILDACEAIKPGTNGFVWFFTSKEKKEKAVAAFNNLNSSECEAFRNDIYRIKQQFDELSTVKLEAAWKDFKDNSIRYINLLEEYVPGILGNDDSVYGLPQELAQEIQDQCFFPEGLLCDLRRYQEWGVKYILHQKKVLLGDEMGLGKTIQAIATMVSLKNTGATHFLVVCPASVVINWCREIASKSKLRVLKAHGAGRLNIIEDWKRYGGVAVTTYETSSYFRLETTDRFSLLVVDEAHYIKNESAKRSMQVRELCTHAERLLFMTGTAIENKTEEMVSLIKVLNPAIARKIQGLNYLSAAPEFREKIAPVYYRRKREDVLTELPEKIEEQAWCEMYTEERRIYEASILSHAYMEARRLSWNILDLKLSSKAERLSGIVQEAKTEGRKIVVFSFFLDTINKIFELFGENCYGPITGSITPQRRQQMIDEFDKAPEGAVLAAQIQAGGTGLNIQSASVVVICEPQFKPSIENQAISRAYRMGQARTVLVYRLLCENTIDEKMTRVLAEKQQIFDNFADKSKAAEETKEIDTTTFGNIIKEEIERINKEKVEEADM